MHAIFDAGAPAPCPAPFNLAAHVLAQADARPDRIALSILSPTGSERWSYARLVAAVRGVATGLLGSGLRPGDRVLLRLGNEVDFPLAFLGAVAAGIVPVPTSAQLTAGEVDKLVRIVRPAAILRGPGVACPETDLPVHDGATLAAWRGNPPAAWDMGDPDRLAYIVFTSGTSGVPRAVMHAHRAIWARRMMIADWYGLGPDDRLAHAGAFNWTYTLGTGLLDPWTTGATALIPAQGVTPAQLPLLLRRHEATILAAAPGVFRQMLKAGTPDLPRLRHGLSAGEKLADPLRAAWQEATGTAIYEAFGMSECSTFISAAPGSPAAPGTLGRPQRGRRVAILGADGTPVDWDEAGEIAVDRRDPGLMLGYFDAPDATARRMSGTWFLTGDRGAMAADGSVTYLGRADDVMTAGGFRISPVEVEAALLAHPGIDEAGVTEVEVRPGVRVIAAFWTGPEAIADDILDAFAAERLARYKQPRLWHRCETLPKSANGKLLRRALADLLPG
ncbi:class I adenylate-forming enzyme family protein [Roseivivax isoporae]|uniref:Benzoate-CoA ligase n=1 Tax=Roseivivax isoporae LMG 25204 TaxID=1449351 RepID=X7F8B2_9RHOB|nr:class I adenylate-forming enzyme family protein [Roseivivax isoporae]ETX28346.1 benzoate-CoA ligase [Roseivivax isoporae LMG 25204]